MLIEEDIQRRLVQYAEQRKLTSGLFAVVLCDDSFNISLCKDADIDVVSQMIRKLHKELASTVPAEEGVLENYVFHVMFYRLVRISDNEKLLFLQNPPSNSIN